MTKVRKHRRVITNKPSGSRATHTVRTIKPSNYQPSKAEMEEEFDMPGADMDTLSRLFFGAGKRPKKSGT